MIISGNLIDVFKREIYPANLYIENGKIKSIERSNKECSRFILPGLIDSHIHIESSMVTPGSFSIAAVSRGTTAVVSDPHEIANVLGSEGIMYMIKDSKKVPLKFYFGAPSCVPATKFETSGASIGVSEVNDLLEMNEIKYLAEMMNFPGVIYDDPEVLGKLEAAKKNNKPVDGHAPGLRGEMLKKYISAGISTDHECNNIEEAREKISLGMKIMIREGSAARNLDALKDLFKTNPGDIMLCSDDLHPEMLQKRHINKLVAKLISEGYDLFDVIRSCTLNAAEHYKLESGIINSGMPADFIIVDNYHIMDVYQTWINGEKVYDNGRVLFKYHGSKPVNNFNCSAITASEIKVKGEQGLMRVIEAYDGDLFTNKLLIENQNTGFLEPDISNDILKIVVKNRYKDSPVAVGFIKGFGLKSGAFASSIAHDSHNIICIGTRNEDIVNAVNEVIKMEGGLAVADGKNINSLKLNIGGIMSDKPVRMVAEKYEELSGFVKSLGCKMSAPFMTLSFMALLVIPELKIGDKGLFDVKNFCLVPLIKD